MSELLYYDVITDLDGLGFKRISLDEEILDIEWIESLDFLLKGDDEDDG